MAKARFADALRKMIHRYQYTFYRCRIGGFGQLFGYSKEKRARRRAGAQTGALICETGDPQSEIRVLYLDEGGWAVRNVGLSWFSHLDDVFCAMVNVQDFLKKPEMHLDYDVVLLSFVNVMKHCKDLVFDRPVIACVQDPFELFGEFEDWKTRRADAQVIGLCKRADFVICTSEEVQGCLAKEGIKSSRIPTASLLPAAPVEAVERTGSRPLTAITVGRIYRRKRFELFKEIAGASKRKKLPIAFHPKFDRNPLPEAEYIAYLDRADVYIVTSFEEGGPLPAMDAMQRGLIVLSTPVGQMPEIIVDGVSGFICHDLSEFVDRLSRLCGDRNLVRQMRRESMDRIRKVRSEGTLHEALKPVLNAAAELRAARGVKGPPTPV